MKSLPRPLTALALAGGLLVSAQVSAAPETYEIDPTHTFIEFSIPHLGFSLLQGRFNDVSGSFTYDEENPAASSVQVEVDPASLDSNHAERDKHLRASDFLAVEEYPDARFESTSFQPNDEGGILKGDLTLHGVTRPITVEVKHIGAGEDPWGGYRRGFAGYTEIDRGEWGIDNMKAPGETVKLEFFLEGVRQ